MQQVVKFWNLFLAKFWGYQQVWVLAGIGRFKKGLDK